MPGCYCWEQFFFLSCWIFFSPYISFFSPYVLKKLSAIIWFCEPFLLTQQDGIGNVQDSIALMVVLRWWRQDGDIQMGANNLYARNRTDQIKAICSGIKNNKATKINNHQ